MSTKCLIAKIYAILLLSEDNQGNAYKAKWVTMSEKDLQNEEWGVFFWLFLLHLPVLT